MFYSFLLVQDGQAGNQNTTNHVRKCAFCTGGRYLLLMLLIPNPYCFVVNYNLFRYTLLKLICIRAMNQIIDGPISGIILEFGLAHGRLDRLSLYEKLLAQNHRLIIIIFKLVLIILWTGCYYPAFILHQEFLRKRQIIRRLKMIYRIFILNTNLDLFQNSTER